MSDYMQTTGLEKASTLLLSLGVDNSSKILQYLGEGEIERVLMALSKASTIPPEIRSMALQEAYAMAQAGTGLRGGGAWNTVGNCLPGRLDLEEARRS
jgi:flagellar motor switch protein FliG